jgi:hypothetical protein
VCAQRSPKRWCFVCRSIAQSATRPIHSMTSGALRKSAALKPVSASPKLPDPCRNPKAFAATVKRLEKAPNAEVSPTARHALRRLARHGAANCATTTYTDTFTTQSSPPPLRTRRGSASLRLNAPVRENASQAFVKQGRTDEAKREQRPPRCADDDQDGHADGREHHSDDRDRMPRIALAARRSFIPRSRGRLPLRMTCKRLGHPGLTLAFATGEGPTRAANRIPPTCQRTWCGPFARLTLTSGQVGTTPAKSETGRSK